MAKICEGLTVLGLMDRMYVQRLRFDTHRYPDTHIHKQGHTYLHMYVNVTLKRDIRQGSRRAQVIRMLAADPEFDLWDLCNKSREPRSSSCLCLLLMCCGVHMPAHALK